MTSNAIVNWPRVMAIAAVFAIVVAALWPAPVLEEPDRGICYIGSNARLERIKFRGTVVRLLPNSTNVVIKDCVFEGSIGPVISVPDSARNLLITGCKVWMFHGGGVGVSFGDENP